MFLSTAITPKVGRQHWRHATHYVVPGKEPRRRPNGCMHPQPHARPWKHELHVAHRCRSIYMLTRNCGVCRPHGAPRSGGGEQAAMAVCAHRVATPSSAAQRRATARAALLRKISDAVTFALACLQHSLLPGCSAVRAPHASRRHAAAMKRCR